MGDVVWAGEHAVSGTLKGFFSGLKQIATPDVFAEPLNRFFIPYLNARTENELMEICEVLLNRYPEDTQEAVMVNQHLKQHIICFHRCVQETILP